MLPINTMQPVVRDTIPPTFSNDAMVSAEVKYGTNIFISGLKALDEGRDISRDIKYSFDELPDTFVEGGSIPTLFYVYDKGGNYIEQEVEVPITGSPKHPTPTLYDFTQLAEIPAAFTQTNGEWAVTENGLMSVGIMPPSPRWNISLDTDADADFQIQFIPVTAGLVHGVTFRGSGLNDMFYCFYRDGVFTLWERFDGVPQEVTFVTDDTLNENSLISLGVSCVGDTLTIYNGSEPIITHRSEQLRFSRQFGIISTSDQAFYQKIMVGQAGTLTFGEYEMANEPPTANAGPDQSVAAATQFILDGTGSQDTDGTIVEWRWTQTAGDTVTLNLEDPARPTAKSPSKTTAQRLTFQLVTVDDEGAESSPGTVNIDVAAFAVSEMLKLLDTRQWTVVNDGSVQAFEGRSNREAFRFQVTPSDGIQTSAEGYFLFDQPGVHAVEVISTPTSKISSVDDPYMIRGDVIAARIGDLQTDENGNLTLTFVLYVTDDKDGLVMTAKVIEPYQKASYFRKQG